MIIVCSSVDLYHDPHVCCSVVYIHHQDHFANSLLPSKGKRRFPHVLPIWLWSPSLMEAVFSSMLSLQQRNQQVLIKRVAMLATSIAPMLNPSFTPWETSKLNKPWWCNQKNCIILKDLMEFHNVKWHQFFHKKIICS